MSFQSVAQEFFVVDPGQLPEHDHTFHIPLEVSEVALAPQEPMDEPMVEVMDPSEPSACEVSEEPTIIEVQLEAVPGAGNPPEPLEVEEEESEPEPEKDENKAKSNKNEKWDWESRGAEGFIAWVKERCDDVPKHSGQDSAGLERAVAYLERLDNEISKAMRMDLDGKLDANQIEKVRATIDNGIERLNERLDKIKKNKRTKGRKKKGDFEGNLVKEAGTPGVKGIYVTVPLFISRMARILVNGSISAGHDMGDMFERLIDKYKLTEREQAEVIQLVSDMGFPLHQDRGYLPWEVVDPASPDNFDWAINYSGV